MTANLVATGKETPSPSCSTCKMGSIKSASPGDSHCNHSSSASAAFKRLTASTQICFWAKSARILLSLLVIGYSQHGECTSAERSSNDILASQGGDASIAADWRLPEGEGSTPWKNCKRRGRMSGVRLSGSRGVKSQHVELSRSKCDGTCRETAARGNRNVGAGGAEWGIGVSDNQLSWSSLSPEMESFGFAGVLTPICAPARCRNRWISCRAVLRVRDSNIAGSNGGDGIGLTVVVSNLARRPNRNVDKVSAA
mmetsp:Transcript_85586/g.135148  ORF Transcript_85586/g.135148 Transcript_85586/m.135148 type:complete len:254 (-) Transcript_85586:1231-1992(-)